MAINIVGTWSSIKPQNDGKRPPMTRDGLMEIETYDQATGAITGYYTDLVYGYTRPMTGSFFRGGNNDYLTIKYTLPGASGPQIIYEGRIVTFKEDDAYSTFIVAGTWRIPATPHPVQATDAAATADAAQEDGMWVVTKP